MIYEKRPLQQLNLQVIEQYREGSPTVPKDGQKRFLATIQGKKSPHGDTLKSTRVSFAVNQDQGFASPPLRRSKSLPINFRQGTAGKQDASSDNKALFWFRPNPEKPLLETRAVTPVHKMKSHRRARTDVPRELSLPARQEEDILLRSQTSERFETALYQEDSLLSFAFTSISFDGEDDEADDDDEIQGLDLLGEGMNDA